MTPEEAIRRIKNHNEVHSRKEKHFAVHITEALNMAVDALEKQIKIQHHHTIIREIHDEARISVCPSCLAMMTTRKDEFPNFCIGCGQAIDWSELGVTQTVEPNKTAERKKLLQLVYKAKGLCDLTDWKTSMMQHFTKVE